MLRLVLALMLMPVLAMGTATAQTGPQPLASAFSAARSGDWATAQALAVRAGDGGPALVEWMRLRAGQGTAQDVLAFLNAHGDWPGLKLLRRKSEPGFAEARDSDILTFFAREAPQTGAGVLTYAGALARSGRAAEAEAGLVQSWLTLDLTAEDQARFLAAHEPLLRRHHKMRAEEAMWAGRKGNVSAMLPLLPKDWQALTTAWLALEKGQSDGITALINAVPAALADHPLLAQARFDWRIAKGLSDEAISLLLERSKTAQSLGRPEAWGGWRNYLAHAEMRAGRAKRAYAIAANHHLSEGSTYAELEWMAGYVALRFLNQAERAREHFKRMQAAVNTPISLSRAAYWIGRSEEALGNAQAAKAAYGDGARYQTAFYGLLAAERGGFAFDTSLAGTETFPDWRQAAFVQTPVFRAAMLALNAGEARLAETFLTHLAESLDRTGLGQLGAFAEAVQQPHLMVMIGKAAAAQGITLARPYYALHPLINESLPIPPELALAIARRESEFDPGVVSGAGAQGLMQLMPGTSAEMAKKLGLVHSPGKVLTDPVYNARLGSAYLAKLAGDFDGNIVLVAAGYNAGPSRARRWREEQGDPRAAQTDIVDWIEAVPFRETRNYIMRVSESLPVYRARLGLDPHPLAFSAELKGTTLLK